MTVDLYSAEEHEYSGVSKRGIFQEHPTILTVIVLSTMGAALAFVLEVVIAGCFSARQFLWYGAVWTVVQLPFLLYRASVRKSCVILLFWGVLVVLFLVPWNSRKSFLRDFDKVHVGMSEAEVRVLIGKYIEGTGWAAQPRDRRSSTLTEVSTGITLETVATSTGELGFRDALVYRHSDTGSFNADWGVVHFANGRVVAKEFMPD